MRRQKIIPRVKVPLKCNLANKSAIFPQAKTRSMKTRIDEQPGIYIEQDQEQPFVPCDDVCVSCEVRRRPLACQTGLYEA